MKDENPDQLDAIEETSTIAYDSAQYSYWSGSDQNIDYQKRYSIYHIDQSSLRPTSSRTSHWSIAWSDLMMTMFILFLSLFVYQATHKDFLIDAKSEIIGGDTRKALEIDKPDTASFPFMVIKPAAPLITSGSVRKIEAVSVREIDLDATFSTADIDTALRQLQEIDPIPEAPPGTDQRLNSSNAAPQLSQTTVLEPAPLGEETFQEATSVNSLFTKSKFTLDANNLNAFASIDLVPDQTMRIVLTGDLLFETGKAALSPEARDSLRKIAAVIKDTKDQIHVEGHTDDVPIISDKFTTNWELSLARANAVTSFLIDDMEMTPAQFIISGYSSYRPVFPNISEENRAANRRVEIVITKSPEPSLSLAAATPLFKQ